MRALWMGLGLTAGFGVAAAILAQKDKGRQRKTRRTLDNWAAKADEAVGRATSTIRQATGGGGELSLNTISREELLNVYGIGPVLADRIIANRPYRNDYDVVERGILPESGYKHLQSELRNRRAG